jgi:hypothetical protein
MPGLLGVSCFIIIPVRTGEGTDKDYLGVHVFSIAGNAFADVSHIGRMMLRGVDRHFRSSAKSLCHQNFKSADAFHECVRGPAARPANEVRIYPGGTPTRSLIGPTFPLQGDV